MENIVTDRTSFIKFVEKLRVDFNTKPHEWKNKTLDDFLEALSAYAHDIQGYYKNTNQQTNADVASWQVFADILAGASMYE